MLDSGYMGANKRASGLAMDRFERHISGSRRARP